MRQFLTTEGFDRLVLQTLPIMKRKQLTESETQSKQMKSEELTKPIIRGDLTYLDGEYIKTYDCAICLDIVSDLTDCGEGHFFCLSCIKGTSKCPVCQKHVSTWLQNKFAERLINNLKVKYEDKVYTLKEYRKLRECRLCNYVPTTDEEIFEHFNSHLPEVKRYICQCKDQSPHTGFCTLSESFNHWNPNNKFHIKSFDTLDILKKSRSDAVYYKNDKISIRARFAVKQSVMHFVFGMKSTKLCIGKFIWVDECKKSQFKEEPLQLVTSEERCSRKDIVGKLPKKFELWFYCAMD